MALAIVYCGVGHDVSTPSMFKIRESLYVYQHLAYLL